MPPPLPLYATAEWVCVTGLDVRGRIGMHLKGSMSYPVPPGRPFNLEGDMLHLGPLGWMVVHVDDLHDTPAT